ncbi:hypothetical protein FH608_024060 [Nonomuraea phyllanthi]|uniref:Uncharacterized protein n=1 Tax=Nonomuraea phyllanthi TaxID=2219224 RepID=A0A5C4W9B1_9ACTN|nr:hypothetical protein [Nonomuraea phyllanthi]KAB8192579.1 hypothetical protein FH608_024060 [Nonomuraea phyllanthi]QFY08056.1 hypothetical protein GBF35_16445 [Nonomuraea phyllanthi]
MTDAQLAALKAKADTANTLNALAQAANGHGVTRVQARKAEAALVEAVGTRKANQMKEDALVRSGARPKGVRRFFG